VGVYDAIANVGVGLLNYSQQKSQYNYQRNLQHTIFQREDNAVQRQAADMQAAGLSKTLAAGGGANAGAVVNTQAPQFETKFNNDLGNDMGVLSLLQQKAMIEKTKADTDRTNAETQKIKDMTPGMVEGQTIANEIARATQSTVVAQTIANLDRTNIQNRLTEINQQLASSKVQLQGQDLLIRQMISRLQEQQYTRGEAELVAKTIANELQRHNVDVYQRLGIPSSETLPREVILFLLGEKAVNELSDSTLSGRNDTRPNTVNPTFTPSTTTQSNSGWSNQTNTNPSNASQWSGQRQ